MRNAVVLAGSLFLGGCTLGPDYARPDLELPSDWQASALPVDPAADLATWWQRFDDPVLDDLVTRALHANLDLGVAAARIAEARAALGFARADRWPSLALQADAARSRASEDGFGTTDDEGATTAGGTENPRTVYAVAGVLDYELDLFGALRSAATAAEARALETAYSWQAVRLAVIADVASTYINLRAGQRQLALALAAQETRAQGVDLERSRLRYGATTVLTVRQAEAELESARSQAASFREEVARAQHALAVLTGAAPPELLKTSTVPEGTLAALARPSGVPPVLPSELLDRRPDVRAAEAALATAHADVAAVRASWFPRINLSLLSGTQALSTGALFSGPAASWSLGGAVVAPLLDFGRRSADVDSARARREQAELLYRQSVQTALREVRDALVALDAAQTRASANGRAAQAVSEALTLAERQYRAGYIRFSEVLELRRSALATELTQVGSERDMRVAAANLFKALGGGWEQGGSPLARADTARP